jgi:hypothetical protein
MPEKERLFCQELRADCERLLSLLNSEQFWNDGWRETVNRHISRIGEYANGRLR